MYARLWVNKDCDMALAFFHENQNHKDRGPKRKKGGELFMGAKKAGISFMGTIRVSKWKALG